jgi:hypothetical protein
VPLALLLCGPPGAAGRNDANLYRARSNRPATGRVPSPGRRHGQRANLVTGRCRPPLAVVQKSTDAEQKRRKRISFLAEIEEPDSDQNAYHGHGYNFEHSVRSGTFSESRAERVAEGPFSQMRRRPTA